MHRGGRKALCAAERAFWPRERGLVEGFESLSDAELLAVLVGTGERGKTALRVAADLIDDLGDLMAVCDVGPSALAAARGIGPAKAARIAAGVELGRRLVVRRATDPRVPLDSPRAVADWAGPRIGYLDHEQVWVLALDGRNGLRAARRVAQGGLHGCAVQPRDVLRAAVRHAASALVLVHNHPSGDPNPSEEDVALTRAVARAALVVGTPLVDHVIVAAGTHASLFDLGMVSGL